MKKQLFLLTLLSGVLFSLSASSAGANRQPALPTSTSGQPPSYTTLYGTPPAATSIDSGQPPSYSQSQQQAGQPMPVVPQQAPMIMPQQPQQAFGGGHASSVASYQASVQQQPQQFNFDAFHLFLKNNIIDNQQNPIDALQFFIRNYSPDIGRYGLNHYRNEDANYLIHIAANLCRARNYNPVSTTLLKEVLRLTGPNAWRLEDKNRANFVNILSQPIGHPHYDAARQQLLQELGVVMTPSQQHQQPRSHYQGGRYRQSGGQQLPQFPPGQGGGQAAAAAGVPQAVAAEGITQADIDAAIQQLGLNPADTNFNVIVRSPY